MKPTRVEGSEQAKKLTNRKYEFVARVFLKERITRKFLSAQRTSIAMVQ